MVELASIIMGIRAAAYVVGAVSGAAVAGWCLYKLLVER